MPRYDSLPEALRPRHPIGDASSLLPWPRVPDSSGKRGVKVAASRDSCQGLSKRFNGVGGGRHEGDLVLQTTQIERGDNDALFGTTAVKKVGGFEP